MEWGDGETGGNTTRNAEFRHMHVSQSTFSFASVGRCVDKVNISIAYFKNGINCLTFKRIAESITVQMYIRRT